MSSPSPEPPTGQEAGFRQWLGVRLSRPVWQGIGAVAGILALVPVLVAVMNSGDEDGDQSKGPSTAQATAGVGCIAQGRQVYVNCVLPSAAATPTISGPPITAAAVRLERSEAYGDTFVFPRPLNLSKAQLGMVNGWMAQLTDREAYYAWARSHEGVDSSAVSFKLVLVGNRLDQVRILDIKADRECTEPLTGTILDSPPSGEELSTIVGFNLDESDPNARTLKNGLDFGRRYFDDKTVSLKYKEQRVFQVTALTSRHYCEFRLKVSVVDGGQVITQTIGNGDGVFKVTAAVGDPLAAHPYKAYKEAYVGGVLNSALGGGFRRVNPSSYSR